MQVLYLGRAPRTKETLPDFREKCRVTRHSRVFPRVDGYSTDPRVWGVTLFLNDHLHCIYSETKEGYQPIICTEHSKV